MNVTAQQFFADYLFQANQKQATQFRLVMRADFVPLATKRDQVSTPSCQVAFSYFRGVLSVKTLLEAHFYPIHLSAFWFCFESLSKCGWLIFIHTNSLNYSWATCGDLWVLLTLS